MSYQQEIVMATTFCWRVLYI